MDLDTYTKDKILEDLKSLQYLYKMKEVIRYNQDRDQQDVTESVAEHVYGMLVLMEYFAPLEFESAQIDRAKVTQMILFHDIDEIETGDVLGYRKTDEDRARELAAMKEVLKKAPAHMQTMMEQRVEEYEGRQSIESKFAKALDKIEPLVQIYNDKWHNVMIENKTTAEESERIKVPYIQEFPFIKKFAGVLHQEMVANNFYWTAEESAID